MPNPLPISSVNHVARVTRNLAASKAFYRDVLGFREVRRPNFPFAGAWLYNYGLQIHLIEPEGQTDPLAAGGKISARADHLAFHAPDTQAVERLLEDHGIRFAKNYVKDRGVTQLFFHDPDGNHIEIGTYPPVEELSHEQRDC
jgi:catechol 2,3-dioxygenase-like lactoylglutathione lyase family enzyme